MSHTLFEATNRVQRQLDDETGEVWTRDQIEDYIQDGYDILCRQAKCLFDMLMFDRQPAAGNHTRDFEVEYMKNMPILGRFNFTRESDREFAGEGALGPMNHTSPDDANFMTVEDEPPSAKTINYLPEGFVEVDRVLHDWLRLQPENARMLRRSRNIYQTEQGGVFSYSMDQDGLWSFRTVGIPVSTINPISISGVFGPIRAITGTDFAYDDETLVTPNGGYGFIRSVPREFVTESQQYGWPRRIVQDSNATRVEYYRLGKDLKQYPFEVPDRAVKYCEWWALHRAYSQPGEGEDKALADHYRARFEMGVKRLDRRVKDVMKERAYGMGQRRQGQLDAYLERFPSDHGRKRPFRG